MYMAYGWPQAIPLLEPPGGFSSPSSNAAARIVYIKVANQLLLVVAPAHLELWSASQHRVRLGTHARDAESIKREGENLQAVWSPDAKTIAVLTSLLYLHIYKVRFSGKKLLVGEKQLSGLSLASISLVHGEKAPLSDKKWVTSNFACDSRSIVFGLSNGSLKLVSWKGEFSESFEIGCSPQTTTDEEPKLPESPSFVPSVSERDGHCYARTAVIQLDLSLPLRLLVVLYSDGCIALCSISKKGMKQADCIKAERWMTVGDAVCAAIASEQQVLAVGCRRGAVELYDLTETAAHLRTVSLYDWGYSVEDTGPVSCIDWSPNNSAFAVGWKCRGLTVWSVSGCRLMSTIRQIGMSSISSPMVKPNQDFKYEPLVGGTSFVQWDEYGYKLYAVEEGSSERILAFSFGKCSISRGLSGTTYVRQVIYGEDRILVVQSDESDDLKIVHLNLPVSYISQNWPILHVVASKDGMYLAIAGLRGLILYDLRYKRWRVFGDITQEQQIECKGLLWLEKIVVVCNFVQSSNM